MPLRTDMPTRADARPGSGDEQHATVYDPARGSWQPPTGTSPTPEPTTARG